MAAIEPEAVFVEIGLDVLSAKAMVDAEPPALQQREDAVHPGQDDMRRHEPDGLWIVRVAELRQVDITRVVVGQDHAARLDIGHDKGVQRGGEVIGDDLQPKPARRRVQELLVVGPSGWSAGGPINDLHGACYSDHALPAADTKRRISLAERDLRLVDFDHASKLGAIGVDHGSAQLGGEQPGGLIVDAELALELEG